MLTKAARLQNFLARLAAAPAATGHDEAFALIAATLNAAEDEHSGVPANPANWQSDGRMYPAQSDKARHSDDWPGVTIYRNRGHHTLIAANGAFRIVDLGTNGVLLEKPGRDGQVIPSARPKAPKNA